MVVAKDLAQMFSTFC